MDAEDRNEVQDAFMAADSMVVVATIAFGMGVDKADIRTVYHYNLPKGLEHYMQEIGRAGRDGLESICELFGCPDDVVTLENFVYGDTPDETAIASLIALILCQDESFDVSIYGLSAEHDVRPLVVRTLLAYLELEGLVEPTGQIYATFKFQPLRALPDILACFDEERAAFLRKVFKQARKGRTWFTIDVDDAGRQIEEARERIVAALDYLERQGDLMMQASGTRHCYRRLAVHIDREDLRTRLVKRFHERERLDVERIRAVLALVTEPGCLTARVLQYFGEQRSACGHCSRCDGQPFMARPQPSRRRLGDAESQVVRKLVSEGHTALSSARQKTRFLCGLTSPATSRARLISHPAYGAFGDVPFADVLAFVETVGGVHRAVTPPAARQDGNT
jgi:ATP-dependent DNA helicase RecQ